MGPGFHYQGTTDLVGPFPQDWLWVGRLFSTGAVETSIASGITVQPIQNTFSGFLGYTNDPGTSLFRPTLGNFPPNPIAITEVWRFSVELQRPTGQVEDQVSVPVTLDMTSGLVSLLERKIQAQAGGFTDADRADAQIVKQSVSWSIPPVVGGAAALVGGVVDLFKYPPIQHLIRSQPFPLQGRGVITRTSHPLLAESYGLDWTFTTVPAGYGVDDGAWPTYEHRMLQLLVVKRDAGSNTFAEEMFEINAESLPAVWGFPHPVEVHYDVSPGVLVTARFFIGPRPQ